MLCVLLHCSDEVWLKFTNFILCICNLHIPYFSGDNPRVYDSGMDFKFLVRVIRSNIRVFAIISCLKTKCRLPQKICDTLSVYCRRSYIVEDVMAKLVQVTTRLVVL